MASRGGNSNSTSYRRSSNPYLGQEPIENPHFMESGIALLARQGAQNQVSIPEVIHAPRYPYYGPPDSMVELLHVANDGNEYTEAVPLSVLINEIAEEYAEDEQQGQLATSFEYTQPAYGYRGYYDQAQHHVVQPTHEQCNYAIEEQYAQWYAAQSHLFWQCVQMNLALAFTAQQEQVEQSHYQGGQEYEINAEAFEEYEEVQENEQYEINDEQENEMVPEEYLQAHTTPDISREEITYENAMPQPLTQLESSILVTHTFTQEGREGYRLRNSWLYHGTDISTTRPITATGSFDFMRTWNDELRRNFDIFAGGGSRPRGVTAWDETTGAADYFNHFLAECPSLTSSEEEAGNDAISLTDSVDEVGGSASKRQRLC